MDNRVIGVFDSGLGGLTAVKWLQQFAPSEGIVFIGDTARVPYGNRTRETLTRFAIDDISYLLSRDVKIVVSACGTISSILPDDIIARMPVPFLGVVHPTAAAAAAATRNKKIGVIGTKTTIASGSFKRALNAIDPAILCVEKACPMLVPLVEAGYVDRGNPVTKMVAEGDLAPLQAAGVDTLILGCTHYPIIQELLGDIMGPEVTLIDSGRETARAALELLRRRGQLAEGAADYQLCTTDRPESFMAVAEMFLGKKLAGKMLHVPLDTIHVHPCFTEGTA